jgi:energy-coupling factor transport system ATP-binding protein
LKGYFMEDIISAENLTFYYSEPADDDEPQAQVNKILVFDGLDLKIKKGSFTVILGHNGCGKSTLAKHMNAILLPCGGKMYAAGFDTSDESKLFDIRKHIGMVFQNPDNQIVASVVEEDVAFALENMGVPPAEMRVRVDEALKAVGMYEYREHSPSQLSGGQKQRVAIAGIIAMRPDCIVLDEPTAMLDPAGRREVMKTIRRLNRENGITISRPLGSRPAVGSSRMSTLGRIAITPAMATLLFWPPESSKGDLFSRLSSMPTSFAVSLTRLSISPSSSPIFVGPKAISL